MKSGPRILLLLASLVLAAQARATVLPDACGDDKIRFDVTAQSGQTAPAPPPAGKAQIVFVENEDHMIGPFKYATIRFGLDGAWAGANYNNSYFVVNIDPGEHHLCASWQSSLGMIKRYIDVASFTAEPGKVYYYAANVKVTSAGDSGSNIDFNLAPLNDDQGHYRIKAWKQAISKPK
jgi:hypothetical protein